MKKRFAALILCAALCLGMAPAALGAEGGTTALLKLDCAWMSLDGALVPVDGENPLVRPIAEESRTLVPVGQIVKAFGGGADWDQDSAAATFTLNGHTVRVVLGETEAAVDGAPAELEVPARAEEGRTYVPLRFVLEGLGLTVDYHGEGRLIYVGDRELPGWASGPEAEALADRSAQERYYYGAARSILVYRGAYMGAALEAMGMAYDRDRPDGEQYADEASGLTWEMYFATQGRGTMEYVDALCAQAQREGFTLPAEGKTELEARLGEFQRNAVLGGYDGLEEYLDAAYGPQVTKAVFRQELGRTLLANAFVAQHEAALTFTEEEIEAWAEANPLVTCEVDYRVCRLPAEEPGEEGKNGRALERLRSAVEAEDTPEARAAAFDRFAAEEAEADRRGIPMGLQTWMSEPGRQPGDFQTQSGAEGDCAALFLGKTRLDMPSAGVRMILLPQEGGPEEQKELAYQLLAGWEVGAATEASFAELARRWSLDPQGIYPCVGQGEFPATIDAWVFDPAREPGDTAVLEFRREDYQGWVVVYFLDQYGPKWHKLAEDQLRAQTQSLWLQEIQAGT